MRQAPNIHLVKRESKALSITTGPMGVLNAVHYSKVPLSLQLPRSGSGVVAVSLVSQMVWDLVEAL